MDNGYNSPEDNHRQDTLLRLAREMKELINLLDSLQTQIIATKLILAKIIEEIRGKER